MAQVTARTQRAVQAPVEQVLAALADYAGARRRMLTPHYSEWEVREGGTGAGTLVHYRLAATSKRVRDCLMRVSEPAEHTLVESDENSSMVNTWEVVPGNGQTSQVSVTTTWDGAGGIGGFFERTFAPKGLGRIHDETITRLGQVVREDAGA